MPSHKQSGEPSIFQLRGRRVVLDVDLARIYGVSRGRLNEAVKRNAKRFPPDFAFQVSTREWANLKSQFAISSAQTSSEQGVADTHPLPEHGGARGRPWAFTEHGALMAANVLHSARAVEMGLYVVRAFVRQREELAANASILKRLAEIDRTLVEHDQGLRILWTKLQPLLAPPPETPRRRIGFDVRDPHGPTPSA